MSSMSSFQAVAVLAAVTFCRPQGALAGLATGVSAAHVPTAGQLRGADRASALDAELGLQLALAEATAEVGRGGPRPLARIEARLAVPARTLPTNEYGRLGPRAVRFLLQHYFTQEHGWTLVGLEPHGYRTDVSKVYDVQILKDKAPGIAALLSERGDVMMSLTDVAKLAAVLEYAIDDEHRQVLRIAYQLNGYADDRHLNMAELDEVMFSYLLLFEMGFRLAHGVDARTHAEYKLEARTAQGLEIFGPLLELQRGVTRAAIWRRHERLNPFVGRRFRFEDVSVFVADLMSAYPKLLHHECGGMKAHLQSMSTPGTGTVPLGKFYAERGDANLEYSFTESLAYLQATGAVDENENIRIANYLPGPTNCMQTSAFFSVCCMSECDGLQTQLMNAIQAPSAAPEVILGALANASWHLVDEPISADAVAKLGVVAGHHSGLVPLHSRLFAQWLHYVFPDECPYPHVPQAEALSVQSWKNNSAIASSEEITSIIEERAAVSDLAVPPAPYWDDTFEELLPLLEPRPAAGLRDVLRCVILAFLVGAILRYTFSGCTIVNRAYNRRPILVMDKRDAKYV